MTSQVQTTGSNTTRASGNVLLQLLRMAHQGGVAYMSRQRDKKLVLAHARPKMACSVFSDYKEAVIESRTVMDTRGRVLAQVKLWIYRDTRKCFREATFLNPLLRTSVGLTRIGFLPIDFKTTDTPAALIEVTVRDFEGWVRNRTAGTQFGIECARGASLRPVEAALAPLPAPLKKEPIAAPVLPVAPVPHQRAVAVAPAAPIQQNQVPASSAVKTQLAAPVQDITRGILTHFGPQERTQGDRKFVQFCVDLTLTDQPNRGTPSRIWGTDLERCLEEAHAKRGDLVEVHFHGSLHVPGGGINRKNSFTVVVLPS